MSDTSKFRRTTRARWCRHFTGIQNITCEAGVTYVDVRDSDSSPYRWPCLHGDLTCEKREYRTAEENAATEAAWDAEWAAIKAARADIVAALEGNAGGTTIVCPKCSESLAGSIASNGHVHGACSTEGCLRWME